MVGGWGVGMQDQEVSALSGAGRVAEVSLPDCCHVSRLK